MAKIRKCLVCGHPASRGFLEFSQSKFGVPLCLNHQQWLVGLEQACEPEFIRFFFEFRLRGIDALLEKEAATGTCRVRLPQARISLVLAFGIPVASLQTGFLETRKAYFRQKGETERIIPIPEAFLNTCSSTARVVEMLLDLFEEEPMAAPAKPLTYRYQLPQDRPDSDRLPGLVAI